MSDFVKVLFCVVIIVYVFSPIDCIPGPIDDILVILLGYVVNRKTETVQRPELPEIKKHQ